MLFILAQLTGCVSYERCQAKFGDLAPGVKVPIQLQAPGDSFTVRIRPEALRLPGDTLDFHSGRARLKVYRDTTRSGAAPTPSAMPSEWDYWAFEVGCDSVILTDSVTCPPQTVFACPDPGSHLTGGNRILRLWRGWGQLTAWLLPLGLLVRWLLRRRYHWKPFPSTLLL